MIRIPFGDAISQAFYSNISSWSKIGYNPTLTTNDEEIWSYGGVYTFPTAAMTIEVASSAAAADGDVGTVLYNATADAGGTTTTLLDATYDWSSGTAAVGDFLIVDKSGTTPEWAVITGLANGVLTFSGGLSSGGSCATARAYQVLDASVSKGVMAVKIEYLDTNYASKTEIVILNANNQVASINSDYFRINSFRAIACGSKATPTYNANGNLTIRKATVATPIYGYILATFTRARSSIYTIPAGQTLYVNQWDVGAATPNNKGSQTARVITRANIEPTTKFRGDGNIFWNYTETLISNSQEAIFFGIPIKIPAKTDIKVSGIGLTGFSGSVTSVLRGYLTTP